MPKGLLTKLVAGKYLLYDFELDKYIEVLPRGNLRSRKVDENSKFNKDITNKSKKGIKIIKLEPKVGDYVIYEKNEDKYFILDILERKNELLRPDCCNVDNCLLVFSIAEPTFNMMLFDKMLIMLYQEKIKPYLILTKKDLINENNKKIINDLKYYEKKLNLEIFLINNLEDTNLNFLRKIVENKITVLMGQSGVGKSSFINLIDNNLRLHTQEISKSLGRGKHTTRHNELYYLFNGFICDTPGFSSIDLNIKDYKEIKNYYPDFSYFGNDCKYSSCLHINEPGCDVVFKYKNKEILDSRYLNYLKIVDEIKNKKKIY